MTSVGMHSVSRQQGWEQTLVARARMEVRQHATRHRIQWFSVDVGRVVQLPARTESQYRLVDHEPLRIPMAALNPP